MTPPWIVRTLGGFHHRATCRLETMQPKIYVTVRWIYILLYAAMEAVGLEDVETYILRHQNTSTKNINTRTILELCLVEEATAKGAGVDEMVGAGRP